MGSLLGVFALVWIVAFLFAPFMGDSWSWDAVNAAGFAAFAGMLYLSLPGQPKRSVKAHEYIGYLVLLLIVAHALWFLIFDAAIVEYLKPGAPDYMWTGIVGVIVATALVALARLPTRLRRHASYDQFRKVHLLLSILTIGLATHHIVASGFYLRTPLQIALFLLVATVVVAARPLGPQPPAKTSPRAFVAVSVVGVLLFTVVRNGLP